MLVRHAIAVAAAVVSMAVGASPASARHPSEFFGVVQGAQIHANDARKMARTGVASMRIFIPWSAVQPSRRTFDWGPTDARVGQLAARGVRTLPFLYATPSWLASQARTPPLRGKKKKAWERFLKNAVRRYGPGGVYWKGGPASLFHQQCGCSRKPKPITAWQVWNEPNFTNYWKPKPSPRGYARLVKISHRAIASVNKHAKVILAGLVGYANQRAWSFLNRMYRVRGLKRAFDATAIHPYARNIRQLRLEIRKFHSVQKRNHDARTPVWLTEHGWGSGPHKLSELNKGLNGQKRLLKRSFRVILHNRKRWHVGRLFWFSWRDGGAFQSGCNFCRSAGLLKRDGSPKPAWHAYRRFAKAR
jgi:hypothetical protein